MSQLNKAILRGTLWSVIGQFGAMAINLLTYIFLARILSPYELGQIGIIMFFVVFANVFIDGGLGGALLRKKEVTKEDYSTVFVFNLIISLVCYSLIIALSGVISEFYNDKSLQQLLVVSSLVLVINAFQITQYTKLMRDLKFKESSLYRFYAILLASVIGLILGYAGLGVWSLVVIQVLNSLFITILFWFYEGACYSFTFNKVAFKSLYSFGVNTTLASLLNAVFDNIYQLILGRYFSINQVGLFYQAKKLQDVPIGIMQSTAHGVVFSTLAKIQDQKDLLIKTYNKIALVLIVLAGLITTLTFIHSQEIVVLIYGDKWSRAAFYLQLLAIASFFYLQELFSRVLFKVYNQTSKILYLEIVKKTIQAVTIVLGVIKADLSILLYGFVFTSASSYLINIYVSKKMLGEKASSELLILMKVIVASLAVIFFTSYGNKYMNFSGIYTLLLIPFNIVLYFLLIYIIGIANILQEIQGSYKLFKV